MPTEISYPKYPEENRLAKDDGIRAAVAVADGKYDNIFCYVKLTEDEITALAEIDFPLEIVYLNILYATVCGFKVTVSKGKEDGSYKAQLAGLKGSIMPLHLLSTESDDPHIALYVLFYKANLIGYPYAFRTQSKGERTVPRFR